MGWEKQDVQPHWHFPIRRLRQIVGMTTNHCISTTVRMSGNLGYETYLISDSTACYNTIGLDGKEIDCNVIFNSAMASLKNEFAEIISSKELFSLVT